MQGLSRLHAPNTRTSATGSGSRRQARPTNALQTLSPLTRSPCDVDFQLPSGTAKPKLSHCNGNNYSASLYASVSSFVRTCKQEAGRLQHPLQWQRA
ncbi:hypothetical protein GGR53DRAFT_513231 [Hypoxylon sp. FL1150]|nr:hypothetical protein GGR53DRAFT_513231 [Hypoxylon sp. FL1150]